MIQTSSIETTTYNFNLLESQRAKNRKSYKQVAADIKAIRLLPEYESYPVVSVDTVRNFLSPIRRAEFNRKGKYHRVGTESKIELIAKALKLDFENDVKIIKAINPETKEVA